MGNGRMLRHAATVPLRTSRGRCTSRNQNKRQGSHGQMVRERCEGVQCQEEKVLDDDRGTGEEVG